MKNKRLFALFFVLFVLLFAVTAAAYEFAPGSDAAVYVSGSGADTNSGADAANAVATLEKAYTLLAASKGGTIVVCGDVAVSTADGFSAADVGGAVVYTSVYGDADYRTSGARLTLSVNMAFANDTYIDNLDIVYLKGSLVLSGGFCNFGIGENVTCTTTQTGNLLPPMLVGGVNYPATVAEASSDKDYTMTVAGGTWQGLMSGNRRGPAKNAIGVLTGDITVRISGGTFDDMGGSQYVSATGANYHTGRSVMEITGGTFNAAIRVFRNIGYLPNDKTLDPGTGVHGQVVIRISGGTFTDEIVVASEIQSTAYIDASAAIIITGGDLRGVKAVRNQGSLGSTVICASSSLEYTLRAKSTTPIYFSNELGTPTSNTMSVHFAGRMNELADPYVVCKDGIYYYCYSSNGVKIMASTELVFGDPGKTAVQSFTPSQTSIANAKKEYWAPELHYFSAEEVGAADAGWYIYVAADNGQDVNHRMYVLRASEPENPLSTFKMVGELKLDGDKWAIDGTVMRLNDKLYFVWSGREANDLSYAQNIYIQEMTNPYTATGKRTMLAAPVELWEKRSGSTVNEGPQILQYNGTTNIVYSVNGSWTQYYSLASLTYLGGDPLDAANWYKSERPIFQSDSSVSIYGTGHASYVQNDLDGTWWIYYHANNSRTVPSGSSWWAERNVYLQEFSFAETTIKGKTYTMPSFGRPLAENAVRTATMETPHICSGEHFTLAAEDGTRYCGICGTALLDADANDDGRITLTDALLQLRRGDKDGALLTLAALIK